MSEKENNIDLFVRLLAKYQGQIYSYILSVIGNFNDSDDILQETSSKLWQMFDQYESGTDFLKWSLSVAYYRILEYRCLMRSQFYPWPGQPVFLLFLSPVGSESGRAFSWRFYRIIYRLKPH